jgi:hypothetical protein
MVRHAAVKMRELVFGPFSEQEVHRREEHVRDRRAANVAREGQQIGICGDSRR